MSYKEGETESDAVPPDLCVGGKEPVHQDDYTYNFNANRSGTCIIFNNMLFDKRTGQSVR